MIAARLHNIREPLRIEDVPVPAIGADEVLVETRTCGICRTDLHIQDGLAYVPQLPHTPGHEPAGVVARVGANVTIIKVGQRVMPHLFLTCGACRYCHSGRDALCSNVRGIIGVTMPGGFAEYFVAPAANLLVLPDSVPFDAGGLVSCAVITAVHAAKRPRLNAGDAAVIIGMGGIGRTLEQILTARGVHVTGIRRSRGSEPPRDVHCVFDCVGTAATMKLAGELVMRGGQIVVIGEEPEFPQIDTIQIAQRELEIIGSRNGSRQDAAEAIRLLADGTIKPPIAAHFPLEKINAALEVVRNGHPQGRVIVEARKSN